MADVSALMRAQLQHVQKPKPQQQADVPHTVTVQSRDLAKAAPMHWDASMGLVNTRARLGTAKFRGEGIVANDVGYRQQELVPSSNPLVVDLTALRSSEALKPSASGPSWTKYGELSGEDIFEMNLNANPTSDPADAITTEDLVYPESVTCLLFRLGTLSTTTHVVEFLELHGFHFDVAAPWPILMAQASLDRKTWRGRGFAVVRCLNAAVANHLKEVLSGFPVRGSLAKPHCREPTTRRAESGIVIEIASKAHQPLPTPDTAVDFRAVWAPGTWEPAWGPEPNA